MTHGRAVLQRVLARRIKFTPRADGGFEAPTRFDRLFAGVVVERPRWIKPGTEGTDHITVADTDDPEKDALLT